LSARIRSYAAAQSVPLLSGFCRARPAHHRSIRPRFRRATLATVDRTSSTLSRSSIVTALQAPQPPTERDHDIREASRRRIETGRNGWCRQPSSFVCARSDRRNARAEEPATRPLRVRAPAITVEATELRPFRFLAVASLIRTSRARTDGKILT
jgi:hypothetical protein